MFQNVEQDEMASEGKYVRAPKDLDPEWLVQSNSEALEDSGSLCSVLDSKIDEFDDRSEKSFSSNHTNDSLSLTGGLDDSNQHTPTRIDEPGCSKSDQNTNERLHRMENVLSNITKALNSMQSMRPMRYDPDEDWSASVAPRNSSESNFSSVRWENIRPFPAGVAANQMWEEWNRYIENFEMAATLSNANDPVRRSQLLFLSMGTELQGIVRAAKLRPSLTDANCYRKFVANIGNYFQSMTDASAEHEAFSNMRQLKSENAVAFHARLVAKVRLCGYSP